MTNLLDFKKSFRRTQRYFYKLSEHSEHTYTSKLKDLYNHITHDPYMVNYFSVLKDGFDELNIKYSDELKRGAVFIPDDKKDRPGATLGFMNIVSTDPEKAWILLNLKYKGKSLKDKYSGWFIDIAQPIFEDVFSEIEFDIESIQERNENKNKDDDEIKIPQNNFHYHGGVHHTQIGNNNIQNININEIIDELNQSNLYSNDDNRTIVVQNVSKLYSELSKDEPSENKIKQFVKRITHTGEREAIKWVFSKFKDFPVMFDIISDLL